VSEAEEGVHEKEIFENYDFVLGQLFADELRGFKIYSRRISELGRF
jgi:hypothetical protein